MSAAPETSSTAQASASAHLDRIAENANAAIDADVATLIDSFRDILSLASIRDKDAYRAAQEGFEAEARAHVMVRAAQSLTLLSHALKLSLLLSLAPTGSSKAAPQAPADTKAAPTGSFNEEARELIRKTNEERKRCIELLESLGLSQVQGDHEKGDAEMKERGKEGEQEAGSEDAVADEDTSAAVQGSDATRRQGVA